jgi:hypothetical protein
MVYLSKKNGRAGDIGECISSPISDARGTRFFRPAPFEHHD